MRTRGTARETDAMIPTVNSRTSEDSGRAIAYFRQWQLWISSYRNQDNHCTQRRTFCFFMRAHSASGSSRLQFNRLSYIGRNKNFHMACVIQNTTHNPGYGDTSTLLYIRKSLPAQEVLHTEWLTEQHMKNLGLGSLSCTNPNPPASCTAVYITSYSGKVFRHCSSSALSGRDFYYEATYVCSYQQPPRRVGNELPQKTRVWYLYDQLKELQDMMRQDLMHFSAHKAAQIWV